MVAKKGPITGLPKPEPKPEDDNAGQVAITTDGDLSVGVGGGLGIDTHGDLTMNLGGIAIDLTHND